MGNLKDVVYCSEEQLNTMASGTPVGDHEYNEDDLYVNPLGEDIILGAEGSNTSINENNELVVDLSSKQDKLTQGSAISLEDDVVAVELFDKDKFTVVGTPTITDDGIASGFSGSNYLTVPINFTSTSNFTIPITFKTSAIMPTTQNRRIVKLANTGAGSGASMMLCETGSELKIWFNTNAWWDIVEGATVATLDRNTKYDVIIRYENNTYSVYVNNVLSWSIVSDKKMHQVESVYLGSEGGDNYFTGSIDLSQFLITVDGVEVFNGTQTIYQALDKKQNVITDLATIRDGASKGATALQSVPDTYATKTYVDNHHDITKQDVLNIPLLEGAVI